MRRLALALQQPLAQDEDHEADGHADPGQAEAGPPADLLAQQAAQDRRPEGTEVDPVVIERESGIPAWIASGIELADDGRDVGLEERHPHDDQGDRQVERIDPDRVLGGPHRVAARRQHGRQRGGGGKVLDLQAAGLGRAEVVGFAADHQVHLAPVNPALGRDGVGLAGIDQALSRRLALVGHGEVPRHQQQGAERHRLARAQVPVGEDAAGQRQQIDQGRVGAVLAAGRGLVEQQVLRQVEDQDAAHPIVGEPLPHLGEEQDDQTARVIAQKLHQHRQAGAERNEDA